MQPHIADLMPLGLLDYEQPAESFFGGYFTSILFLLWFVIYLMPSMDLERSNKRHGPIMSPDRSAAYVTGCKMSADPCSRLP